MKQQLTPPRATSPLTKQVAGRAIERGYDTMIYCYKRYGIGEPSVNMMNFFKKVLAMNPDLKRNKRQEYEALLMLCEGIVNHPRFQDNIPGIDQQLSEVV